MKYTDPRIAQYEPLVRNRARSFYRGRVRAHRDLEDLQAVAREAVWRATQTHRLDGGASFGTYVSRAVFHALNNERVTLNKAKRNGVVTSLSPTPENDEPIVLVTETEGPDAPRDASDRRRVVRAAVDELAPPLKELIERRYWRDQTLEQIGTAWNQSREWVRRLEMKAFSQLRPKLKRLWCGLEAA